MATTADIKIGMCIELDGKTFQIVDFQHVKPGKGPAFVRTKLKNLENGRVLDNTFSAGVKIEPVRVERRPYQFTYEDDLGMHFIHTETFEEINIDKNLINNYDLMADGQIVEVMFHTEKETVLSAELPPIVDMEVTYTEPGVKGDTASTNSLKPATVNTGPRSACRCSSTRATRSASIPVRANTTSASSRHRRCRPGAWPGPGPIHPGRRYGNVSRPGFFVCCGEEWPRSVRRASRGVCGLRSPGYKPGVSNSSITRSILRRISAVQRLPMLPSWV